MNIYTTTIEGLIQEFPTQNINVRNMLDDVAYVPPTLFKRVEAMTGDWGSFMAVMVDEGRMTKDEEDRIYESMNLKACRIIRVALILATEGYSMKDLSVCTETLLRELVLKPNQEYGCYDSDYVAIHLVERFLKPEPNTF